MAVPYYLMLDVGGTGIKGGVLDRNGFLKGNIRTFPARANDSRENIFRNFADILEEISMDIPERDAVFRRIGMAFPGPFDYERGVSLMQGLNKYDAIFGASIQNEILCRIKDQERLCGEDCRFLFLNDVEAFALGECRFGRAAGCERVLCLCIGTGAGSAFVDHGKIVKKGKGIPEQGWIYNTPFLEGRIDDYISARGLKRLAREEFLTSINGAELYDLAREGDLRAKRVFARFGTWVLAAIEPFLLQFVPDGLVLGGQIVKSYPFFGEELDRYCGKRQISVYLSQDTSRRTMEGLYVGF